MDEELRLYLVVRRDILKAAPIEQMFPKMLAQAGHAFVGVLSAARAMGESVQARLYEL